MSIINFSPHSQYLHSPISIIHIIKLKYKILITLLYLLITPFNPRIIMILLFIFYFIYFILLKYIKLKVKYKNKIIQQISLYTIIFIVLILSYKDIFINHYRFIKIYYPYFLRNSSLLIIGLRYYYIPYIIIKSFFFIYSSIWLLNIFFYTTKLEDITISLLYIIHKPNQFKNLLYILFNFSSSISSQFLYYIMQQLNNIFISSKIRKISQKNMEYKIYLYYFRFFINQIINNIKIITYTLYHKELKDSHFYLISI